MGDLATGNLHLLKRPMSLRLFHTADWHLGQLFHNFDREVEHDHFLAWLLETLAARKPDALLLAGDVFDSINPPASAQRRFYQFLAKARSVCPKLQIVVTAGNHDAASRLEAPSALLDSLGIRVVGTVVRDAEGVIDADRFIVPLHNLAGEVEALALAVPFLRPADVPSDPEAKDPYLDGIRAFYRLVIDRADAVRKERHPQAALVALGHCHLNGTEESRDSERRLIIGGSEALGLDVFPSTLAYVALGHLHKPQEIDGGRICYSGSPIPLSFAERDYSHRVLEVTLADGRFASSQALPIPKKVSLLRMPASGAVEMQALLRLIAALPTETTSPPAEHPFLEVHVLVTAPDPTRRRTIEEALRGKAARLALIKLENSLPADSGTTDLPASTAADLGSLSPEALMVAAHVERYRTEPDPALRHALQEILTQDAVGHSSL